jgi:hypothetical protein
MKYIVVMISIFFITPTAQAQSANDDRIRQIIIQQSIASYPGSCACPYSIMRNGRRCGRRSAYSKPGGYDPLCYKKDIPDQMVEQFKKQLSRR